MNQAKRVAIVGMELDRKGPSKASSVQFNDKETKRPMNEPRFYIIILGGILLGAWLVVSTLRRRPQTTHGRSPAASLHPLDAAARLALGVGLALEAIFLFIGVTFWQGQLDSAVPGWAVPMGATVLAACVVSAAVAGAFALARRLGVGVRHS